MISKSRRDSVGGGVVASFFRVLQKPTRQWMGGSSRSFFRVLRDQTTFGGGGGGSNRNFPLSSVAKSHFYPSSSDIRG